MSFESAARRATGPSGYFDDVEPQCGADAQLEASAPLFGEDMDVLLWPEGGIDSDPLADAATASTLDALARRVDAPLIVNAATTRGEDTFNTSHAVDRR